MAVVIRKCSPISVLLLGLLISTFYTTSSFAQEVGTLGINEGPVTIGWESLDTSYRVEVRRDGQVFIDTEQSENELKLNLAPGFYEYRIHVLNPFEKEVSVSGWLPLTVESSKIPYFRVTIPEVVWEGATAIEMTLEATQLRPETVFNIVKDQNRIPVEWRGAAGVYTVTVSDDNLNPGNWDLEALDPSGETFVHPDALVVRPTRSPVIEDLSTRTVVAGNLVSIEVSGEAFDPETTFTFEGPGGELPVAAMEINEEGNAVLYLDLKDAKAAEYDLIASNPSGEETRENNALLVTEAEAELIVKKQPRFEMQLGYAPLVIVTPEGEILPSYLAFDIAATFQSGWKAKFLRGLGIEARGVIGATGPNDAKNLAMNIIGSVDVSGYWRPLVKGKVAPVVLLGFGNLWSGYAKQFGIENILFFRTGLAMDIVNQRQLTRIGINLSFGFTEEDTLPIFQLMFRRGFRM